MESEYAARLRAAITEPLEKVLGQPLRAVVYYVLAQDAPTFDNEAPNPSGGCQGVLLTFRESELELDWDWQSVLRLQEGEDAAYPALAYHLVACSNM